MPRTLALTVATILLAGPLAAEQQDGYGPVEPGTRVRLTSCFGALATACTTSAGTLSSWRRDSVLMRPEGHRPAVGVPAAWVTGIEVSRGRRNSMGLGAVVGFIPGLVMLAGVTFAPKSFGIPTGSGCSRSCMMTASLGISVLGSTLGAFIGTGIKTERWERLPFPPPQ